nr:MAG TPA: hypothetical protein [Caudoviricetes sp.]
MEYGQRTGSIEIWDKLEDIFNVHQRLLRCNSVPKDSRS